jgi:PHD/YefM family antitoxin component YafN of YafNO toxin-antitoxin module
MNTITIVALIIARVLAPLAVLISLGEWMKRRETNYWLRM